MASDRWWLFMKEIKNYIVLVDSHKPARLKHNTSGRYRVGAKSEKEAKQLVQDKIKFGNVQVYYECTNDAPNRIVGYKEVVQEISDKHIPARSAIEPVR